MKEIQYSIMDLKNFAARVQGHVVDTYECAQVSMEIGEIKYYDGIPYSLSNKKLEYYYILATVKDKSKNRKNRVIDKVIGMVELQVSPYDNSIIWLDFISVQKDYKNKGIGKKMSEVMAQFLSKHDWQLERSRPSDEGLEYIKHVIDDMIKNYGIKEILRPKY